MTTSASRNVEGFIRPAPLLRVVLAALPISKPSVGSGIRRRHKRRSQGKVPHLPKPLRHRCQSNRKVGRAHMPRSPEATIASRCEAPIGRAQGLSWRERDWVSVPDQKATTYAGAEVGRVESTKEQVLLGPRVPDIP